MIRKNVNIDEVLSAYFGSGVKEYKPFGNGHINDTFLIDADRRYILQRINTDIFSDPEGLMDNMIKVTEHIRKKTAIAGGDVERCSLVLHRTLDGSRFYRDKGGLCWRLCDFTEGTVTYEKVESKDDFYRCAEAFGEFQRQLADFPAEELCETIKNFHNTPWRYQNLMIAAEKNAAGRLCEVEREISFIKERESFCHILEDARKRGELPLRVTHNDTKLNNILFDKESGRAICVIDLDTVMPGYSVNDFGDAIRFGANTAEEDETDISRVALDLELFEAFAEGFIKGCGGSLTDTEIKMLPIGAMMMTLECGMRFLADYLDGDVYFKTHREGHNLDRARNQLALFYDMEQKLDKMNAIVSSVT